MIRSLVQGRVGPKGAGGPASDRRIAYEPLAPA